MSSNAAALTVGLKYCGGCKPDYDRVALVETLQRRLGDRVNWVRADDPAAELILAVHGCLTACADLEPYRAKPIVALTGPESAEAFVRQVQLYFERSRT
jgi:hypothetical protein